jgi:hypothetical protein
MMAVLLLRSVSHAAICERNIQIWRLPMTIGSSPYFASLYKRHRARDKKANIAITIVARQICQIVWSLLKEPRPYRPQPKIFSPAAPARA